MIDGHDGLRHLTRVLLATAFAAAASSVLARPLDDVKAAGSIRIAMYSDNKPFSDREKDGEPYGIDVDIAKAIAAELKVKPQIVLYDASEDMGGDFRLNLWKGDLVGSPLADLMLQVPNDRVLALRDDQVALTAPYFMQHLAYAYQKDKVEKLESLNDIGTFKVAVEGTSSSDLALMTAVGGRFRTNATHFLNFDKAIDAFKTGEEPIIAGTEAQIQAAFFENKVQPADNPILVPTVMGPVKNHWELAGAVRANSRDLGYAVGDILTAMVKDGRLKTICAKYGVTFTPPDSQ
jgi:polar amino acid transport system substrate-binding protein